MANYTLGRIGIVPKGAYASQTYNPLDMVTYQGSCYVCTASTASAPSASSAYWMQVLKGAYDLAKGAGYTASESQFGPDLAAMQGLATQLSAI